MSQVYDLKDLRRSRRKNVFLSAVVETQTGKYPIRVRNMCATGAMIEGADLPKEGSAVMLRRGSLQAHGHVAWCRNGECGLLLVTPVDVERWLAPPANARQAEVDAMFGRSTAVHSKEAIACVAIAEPPDPTILRAVAILADLLRAVGDRFTRDPIVLTNYTLEMQAFDVAAQALEAMAQQGADPTANRLGNATEACKHLVEALVPAESEPKPDWSKMVRSNVVLS